MKACYFGLLNSLNLFPFDHILHFTALCAYLFTIPSRMYTKIRRGIKTPTFGVEIFKSIDTENRCGHFKSLKTLKIGVDDAKSIKTPKIGVYRNKE
jgi:hypothetical protein